MDETVADKVTINESGRDTDGLRDRLPVKGKLLVKEVKGGRAMNTGMTGVEEPCGGREIKESGFETLKGVLKLGRPDNAQLRQADKLMDTDIKVHARPSVPDKPKVP